MYPGESCPCVSGWKSKLYSFLIALALAAHLLAMNLAVAGPMLCIWLWGRNRSADPIRGHVGRTLASASLYALAIGSALGAMLWLFGSKTLNDAIMRMPTRGLWFAGLEILFSLACIWGCVRCWKAQKDRRWLHAGLALLSSSNLLYHFPPLMTVLSRLAIDPNWAREDELTRPVLLSLMSRPEVLALTAHFAIASVAASAITCLWMLRVTIGESSSVKRLAKGSAWIALVATALQLPVGVWLMVSLPKSEMTSMMGNNVLASLSFLGALLLTFMLLQRLLNIAIGEIRAKDMLSVAWILVALVFLMTITLLNSRQTKTDLRNSNGHTKKALEVALSLGEFQGF